MKAADCVQLIKVRSSCNRKTTIHAVCLGRVNPKIANVAYSIYEVLHYVDDCVDISRMPIHPVGLISLQNIFWTSIKGFGFDRSIQSCSESAQFGVAKFKAKSYQKIALTLIAISGSRNIRFLRYFSNISIVILSSIVGYYCIHTFIVFM